MTYEEYCKAYIVDPPPEQRFHAAFTGAVLYFAEFERAVAFYTEVLGPPAYVEGESTRGWFLGATGLTLLRAAPGYPAATSPSGAPRNTELCIQAADPAEVDRMHAAFLAAGATGEPPVDTLMYRAVRYASVVDLFGTVITITAAR